MVPIRPGLLAVIVCILCGTAGNVALAASRIALVIGNSNYRNSPLANPVRDATLMASTLRSVGFEVLEYTDLDRRSLRKAFITFGDRLQKAGKDTTALIYYAGHGIQVEGENYLIPIGARIEVEVDVEIEGVRATSLLRTLRDAQTALNIVILDACRNNPFQSGSRSAHRGLARMDVPTGTLLAYSTAPGRVAEDGDGRNSTYTRALAKAIRQPGAKIEDVFKVVRVNVMDRTQGRQVPWESSSLTGDFIFLPGETETARASSTAPSSPQVDDTALEFEFWKSVSDSTDPGLFQAYLDRFPNGTFAAIAEARVKSLTQAEPDQAVTASLATPPPTEQTDRSMWEAVKTSKSAEQVQTYLDTFPDGEFAALAHAKLGTLNAAVIPDGTNKGYDGAWHMEGKPVAFRRYSFAICGRTDSLDVSFFVSNGKIEGTVYSENDEPLILDGRIESGGEIDVRLTSSEGGKGRLRDTIDITSPNRLYSFDIKNDNGAYCKYEITLARG